MPEEIYEVISLGARWWFILLGVLIVLRSFRWIRRDGRRTKRRLRQLPDAGMVGEMVVITGSRGLKTGVAMSVPREGLLGSYRSCDLVVPVEGVAPVHCDFSFADGRGLLLYPRRNCLVKIDGEEYIRRGKARKHPMTHGSRLQVGDAVLRLRLFEGIEAPPSRYVPNDTWHDDMDETLAATDDVYRQSPMAWSDATPDDMTGTIPYQPYPQPGPFMPYQPEPYQPEPYRQPPYQTPDEQAALQHTGADEPDESAYDPAWPPDAKPHPRVHRYRSGRRRGDGKA